MKIRKDTTYLGVALLTGVSAAVFSAIAYSQTPPPTAPNAALPVATAEPEEITITGSRLQNTGFVAPTPVTVVGTKIIEQRAPANIADVLHEQPAFRITLTDSSRVGSGNSNVNPLPQTVQQTLDLRALGATRTLTLLNGHRSVGTNWDGTVDSSIVPVGLVERVDVVTGGASAAYGSDAVAGVVNIILRNHMKGVKATAQTGFTEYGAGKQYTFALSGGTAFLNDRMHVIAGIDYNKTGAITDVYGKKWAQDEIGNFTPTAAQRIASGLPQTVITTGVEPASTAPGGLFVASTGQAYTFDASGNPVAFSRGTVSTNGQLMTGSTSNYGHNLNDQAYLRLPLSRIDTLGRMDYDLTAKINAFIEVGISRTSVSPYRAGESQQGTGFGVTNPTITVSRTNSFVTPATLALLGTATTFTIGRNHTEFGFQGISGNGARQDAETRRIVAGLEGSFGESWKWDAYYQSGKTHLEIRRNDFSAYAVQKAVNGCNTATGFNATSLILIARYETLSGKTCVPFNPFGIGRNSAAALNYVQSDTVQIQDMKLDVIAASLSGEPFAVPAGYVAVATGAEYRRESLSADSDDVSAAGIAVEGGVLTNNLVESFGKTSVKEAFAEVGVPLLKDQPGARSLDLNAAMRFTDYELSGKVKTWKVGLSWVPLDALRLRLTRSRDIRAPNLRQLFFTGGPNANNVNTTLIPVGTVGLNGTIYNPPAGTASTALSISVPGGSGNPALRPEIADTTTGGVVFTMDGFNVSADYYQINMKDAINTPTAQQTIDGCVAGDRTYCNFITFNSTIAGGIFRLEPLQLNLNKQVIKGYDLEVGYRMPLAGGNFSVRGLVNYQPHNYTVNTIVNQTTENANTLGSQPKIGYNLSVGYDAGPWTTNVQIRGFAERRGNNIVYNADGSINASTTLGPEDGADYDARGAVGTSSNTINKNRWPGQYTINPSVSYRISDQIVAFANVDNLLNVAPPSLSASAVYDLVGRRYRAGLRFTY